MARHRIKFRYDGQKDDEHILLAFSKKRVEHRKEWLTNFMVESKRRKEIGLPEKYLYAKDTRFVSYTDFVNLELVLFSNADNVRSIPCLVDGLKPGQRKVLYTCIKRNDKREVKVAQLAGSVAEHSAYHHGEVSLSMTIVNLAQNFVGSNNINLLEPRGQFGTRLTGGKDSASPRYIFTKMSPLTRMIFHPNDDSLLKHEYDDNQKIEPTWYIPIIPMILVNGADGIGTGWMTKIPNYNPRDLVQNIRALIDGEDVKPMIPWYKNFKGTIEDCGENRYVISGEIAIIAADKLEITELPIGTWTQNYKENVLEPLLHGSEKVKAAISDYKEYNTDTTVKFIITCLPGQLENMEKEGLHKVFKLQTMTTTTSMCVFDELGCLRRFESVVDILKEFFVVRLKMYQKRKDFLEGMLESEASRLSNQARFITEKCNGKIVVENKKRKQIVDELVVKGYDPDPVIEWKRRVKAEEDEEITNEDEEESLNEDSKRKNVDPEKAFKNLSEVKKFDYLLGMSMWMLTEEKMKELLRQRDNKLTELDILRNKTKEDLWKEDLDHFLQKLGELEQKERDEEAGIKSKFQKVTGKKKVNLQETMPSPVARRIEPTIGVELKKKIQSAIKTKERSKKGIKKENITEDEKDEFDIMIQSEKKLKDKIGTPEEVEKSIKKKQHNDGLKQTKLNFKRQGQDSKANGSPKKRRKKLSDFDSDKSISSDPQDSDSDLPIAKVRPNRVVKKPQKYIDDADETSEDELEPIFDNVGVKEDKINIENTINISGSESEVEFPSTKPTETSEDMFDSLIGKKSEETSQASNKIDLVEDIQTITKNVPKRKRETKKKSHHSDSSEDDMFAPKNTKKKGKPVSDDDFSDGESKKRTKSKKQKSNSDNVETTRPTKSKKKNVFLSDDSMSGSEFNITPPVKSRSGGRARKQTNYVFDDDDDSN